MSIYVLLVTLLAIALVGSLPVWSFNTGWGYAPSGAVGMLLIVAIALLVMGLL
jgi:hypothetical protein